MDSVLRRIGRLLQWHGGGGDDYDYDAESAPPYDALASMPDDALIEQIAAECTPQDLRELFDSGGALLQNEAAERALASMQAAQLMLWDTAEQEVENATRTMSFASVTDCEEFMDNMRSALAQRYLDINEHARYLQAVQFAGLVDLPPLVRAQTAAMLWTWGGNSRQLHSYAIDKDAYLVYAQASYPTITFFSVVLMRRGSDLHRFALALMNNARGRCSDDPDADAAEQDAPDYECDVIDELSSTVWVQYFFLCRTLNVCPSTSIVPDVDRAAFESAARVSGFAQQLGLSTPRADASTTRTRRFARAIKALAARVNRSARRRAAHKKDDDAEQDSSGSAIDMASLSSEAAVHEMMEESARRAAATPATPATNGPGSLGGGDDDDDVWLALRFPGIVRLYKMWKEIYGPSVAAGVAVINDYKKASAGTLDDQTLWHLDKVRHQLHQLMPIESEATRLRALLAQQAVQASNVWGALNGALSSESLTAAMRLPDEISNRPDLTETYESYVARCEDDLAHDPQHVERVRALVNHVLACVHTLHFHGNRKLSAANNNNNL